MSRKLGILQSSFEEFDKYGGLQESAFLMRQAECFRGSDSRGREIQIKVAFLPSGRRSIARTHLLAEALVDALGPVEGALAGHGPTLFLQKVILYSK